MEVQCEYSDNCGKYTCKITEICLTERDTEIKKFNGTHLKNKSAKDVECLWIIDKTVKFCPINLHKKFKNLVWLKIWECGLKKISKNDLAGLENLEVVNFNHNNLTKLPDDLFANTSRLNEVYFYGNKLKYLSSELLSPLESTLTFADFRDNVKINEYFSKDDFTRNFHRLLAIIDRDCIAPKPDRPEVDEKDRKLQKLDNLCSHFENFMISGKYSDLTIEVRGKEFLAHKNILAAQSSVFDDMFTADSAKGVKSFTKIQNFSENSFESFLSYFYTGCLEPEADAVEIFKLASEFEVSDLKTASIEIILENLNEDNALQIFNLGKQHASDKLMKSAFKTLKTIYPDLIEELIDDAESIKNFIETKKKIAAMSTAKTLK